MIGIEDLLVHSCSQKMKCVVVDCLKNQKASVLFDDSSFLLYMFQSNQANLHLFNPEFTAVTQTFKISQIDSNSCCSWIKKENKFYFIHTSNSKVIVNKFEEKDGEYVYMGQECRVQCKFESKDGFKLLSQSFSLNQREEVIVAYSKNDEFYSILCRFKDKKMYLFVSKLVDLQRPSGFMSWFTKQKPTHYEQVKILPLLTHGMNSIRVLCIKDSTVGVYQVFYYNPPQLPSIKQLYTCKTFSKAIKDKDVLLSAQLLSESSVLLAYSVSSKLTLVKLAIEDHQSCITYETFTTHIPANNIKMHFTNQNIYLTVKESNAKYQCYKSSLTKLDQLTNKEAEPMIERKDPMWLTGNAKELFLINSHSIYVVEQLHHFKGDISDEERRFSSYQGWVDRTFNKKIKKYVQQSLYHDVEGIYSQKEESLIGQLKHFKNRNIQNQQITGNLSQKIACSSIIRAILSKQTSLNEFLRQLKQENPKIQDLIEQDLLDLVIMNQSPSQIKRLVKVIARMGISQQISKHQLKQECQKTINEVFSQVCQQAILTLQKKKEGDKYQLKMLLQFTFRFISVKQGKFVDTFLDLAYKKEHHKFIQNLVLNHKLIKIFMHLFIYSSIPFTSNDVLEMVSFLEDKETKIKYLSQFFYRFRQVYIDNKSNKQLIQKAALLMKGLEPFFEQIGHIVEKNFPGLSAYLLINNKNRKHFRPQISQIAKKCSLPFTSYMLNLSNFDKTKSSLQTLAKIRLFEELHQPYSQSLDILSNIESGKYENKSIRGQVWQKSIQTLGIGKDRADKMAKKIKII